MEYAVQKVMDFDIRPSAERIGLKFGFLRNFTILILITKFVNKIINFVVSSLLWDTGGMIKNIEVNLCTKITSKSQRVLGKIKMVLVYLFCLIFISTFGQHAHRQHIDSRKIKSEILRLNQIDRPNLEKAMNNLTRTLTALSEKYYQDQNMLGDETLKEFVKVFSKSYQESADYLIITSALCKMKYAAEFCNIDDDLWDQKLDTRGIDFMHELSREVSETVTDVVSKKQSLQRINLIIEIFLVALIENIAKWQGIIQILSTLAGRRDSGLNRGKTVLNANNSNYSLNVRRSLRRTSTEQVTHNGPESDNVNEITPVQDFTPSKSTLISNDSRFYPSPEKNEIRNTPVINSKYSAVWQRAKMKLKMRRILGGIQSELQIFGTNAASGLMKSKTGILDIKSFLKEKDQIQIAIVTQQDKVPFCMLHPNGYKKTIWNYIMVLLLVYTATVMPFRLAFIKAPIGSDWFWAETVIDFLFFCDIFVNFFSAFYNSEGKLVVNRKKIAKSYAKSWMLFDITACIPFHLISAEESVGGDYNNLIRLLRLPRLYRLIRVAKIFQFLLSVEKSGNEFAQKIQNFTQQYSSVMSMIKILFIVGILSHIMAWMWVFVVQIEGLTEDSWIYRYQMMDYDNGRLYLAALYWSYSTMVTVGFGDIAPKTPGEVILAFIWMLFGVCFYSFTIGHLSSQLQNADSDEMVLQQKLQNIEQFSKEANLDIELKQKLRHALQYSNDQGVSWYDKSDVFNSLPKNLRYEAALNMHGGAAKHLQYFQGKDPVFVSAIVPFMQPMFYEMGSLVYEENGYADEFYFIKQGKVNFVFGLDQLCYQRFQSGSYFGEKEVIDKVPRQYTAQVSVNTDLLSVSKTLIPIIKNDFPLQYDELVNVAKCRDEVHKRQKLTIMSMFKEIAGSVEPEAENDKDHLLEYEIEQSLIGLQNKIDSNNEKYLSLKDLIQNKMFVKDYWIEKNLNSVQKSCNQHNNLIFSQITKQDKRIKTVEKGVDTLSDLLQDMLRNRRSSPAARTQRQRMRTRSRSMEGF